MSGGAPNIEDEGGDGHPFGVIDLWSDPGAWADALRFAVNIRILPDEPLKRPLDAAKGDGDTDAPVSAPVVSLSLHSPTDTDERPQDHE